MTVNGEGSGEGRDKDGGEERWPLDQGPSSGIRACVGLAWMGHLPLLCHRRRMLILTHGCVGGFGDSRYASSPALLSGKEARSFAESEEVESKGGLQRCEKMFV